MRLAKRAIPVLFAVVVMAVGPLSLHAQRAVRDSVAHSDSLRDIAIALQGDAGSFYQAAVTYRDGARYRSPLDPTAIGDLILAGRLLVAAGQEGQAMSTLEEAAERARAMGDVQRAAEAYLDAAFVAQSLGDDVETQRLGHNAAMLATSPLLTEEQTAGILRRLDRPSPGDARNAALSAADSLHEAAMQAQTETGDREAAGMLFMEEAEQRPADDPGAVDVMIVAANLFYSAGLSMRAMEVLLAAGERAEASGDLLRAARAYLDAAAVAQMQDDASAARAHVERASALAGSPLLSQQQRDQILRRVSRAGG